jgi:hypothetical protein
MITVINPLTAHEAQHITLEGSVAADGRFGDEGKLWHLGAVVIVGFALWVIAIDAAHSLYRLIFG